MFIGRDKELETLERLYQSDKFEFAVIYGRRRVGKATLINEFIKGKKTYFIRQLIPMKNRIWNYSAIVLCLR